MIIITKIITIIAQIIIIKTILIITINISIIIITAIITTSTTAIIIVMQTLTCVSVWETTEALHCPAAHANLLSCCNAGIQSDLNTNNANNY